MKSKPTKALIVVLWFLIFVVGGGYLVYRAYWAYALETSWGSKDHDLDTLTPEQTETLAEYFGLPGDALENVTRYHLHDTRSALDTSVSFVAQVDSGVIDALIKTYNPQVDYPYPEPREIHRPDAEGLYHKMCFHYVYAASGEAYGQHYCEVYRLSDGSGYYFYTCAPESSIRFGAS